MYRGEQGNLIRESSSLFTLNGIQADAHTSCESLRD